MRALLAAFTLLAGAAWAQEDPSKFRIDGSVLIYDTEVSGDGMKSDDIDALKAILGKNPGITTLELNSGGGSIWAGEIMAAVVIDYDLDTRVNGLCDSACVTLFLGGKARSMTRGSRIGFHTIHWSPDATRGYYEDEKDDRGWTDPFDFASWIYSDTQQETYLRLAYMVSRGVDPGFAIQSLRRPDDNFWRPSRAVLRAAGVLTE